MPVIEFREMFSD